MSIELAKKPLLDKRILIMEDDAYISKVYMKWFHLAGATVMTVNDGALGLQALEKHHIDMIILDLGMPGMNGIDTLKALKANEATKNIPVIILTNTTQNENRAGFDEIKKAGVTDILRKYETSLSDLIVCVNRYFPQTLLQTTYQLDA